MTLLGKLRKYLNSEVALLLYKTVILPYFDYADVIFHRANVKETGRLQILQNKCLRTCLSKDRRFSKSGSHKLVDTAFLKDRREAHVNNFMYVRRGNKSLLNNRESRTRAHDAPLFDVVVPKCEAFKRSIMYFGSLSWNCLPVATLNIDNYPAFRNTQKQTMLYPLSLIPEE